MLQHVICALIAMFLINTCMTVLSEEDDDDLECFNCFHMVGQPETLDYPCFHEESDVNPPKRYLSNEVGLKVNVTVPSEIADMEARFLRRAKVSGKSRGSLGYHCTATIGKLDGETFILRYKSVGKAKHSAPQCSTQLQNPEPFGDNITEGVQCICAYKACNGFDLYQNNSEAWINSSRMGQIEASKANTLIYVSIIIKFFIVPISMTIKL